MKYYKKTYVFFQKNVGNNLKLRYNNKEAYNIDKISIISTNVNTMKNEKISNFKNINDLIDYSLCSSYIPYISGNNLRS